MKARALVVVLLTAVAGWTAAFADQRTDAVLLVNSASASYADAQDYIRPYLDQFGVPYTVLDIAVSPLPSTIGDYALIIVGHKQIDIGNVYLSPAEHTLISAAVQNGSGLVNFDSDLSPDGNTPRYPFVQNAFGFSYMARQTGENVHLSATAPSHYITRRFGASHVIGTGPMTSAGVVPGGPFSELASLETVAEPFLMARTTGSGRALQWGSYEWMAKAVKGPAREIDGLMWRGLVWAARKPFVLQGLPNFMTMRVDDVHGGFSWFDTANAHGFKPWVGLFYRDILETDAQKLGSVVNAGLGTASVHAKGASGGSFGDFFYFDHYAGVPLSTSVVNANFDHATAWHTQHGIPISKYVLGHWYEMGPNVFTRLQQWGVQFVGTHMEPGLPFVGSPWLQLGPYRLFETGLADYFTSSDPVYYADFLPVPGHSELDNAFFNCVTEIRDDASYEWYPDNDVAGTIGRGTRQTKRALDGMFLSTLFTHEQFIQTITPANWDAELKGVTDSLKPYAPIYVTLDYACQYVRAMKTSNIASSTYDPGTRVLTTNLSGATDLVTQFHAFVETGGEIGPVMVDVPVFSGSTQVQRTLPGGLHHITVTPGTGSVPPGTTQQFVATGYDIGGAPIPGLTFTWGATTGGMIDDTGLFTAGGSTGVFTNAISATSASITGNATVEVYAPVLQGFDFPPIGGTLYAGSAFPITINARDQHSRPLDTYTGQAQLSDTTSTISPMTTGSFAAGVWTGNVTISTVAGSVTITATDGGSNGTSNAFGLLAPRSGEIVINCWDDQSQEPYLPTTTSDIPLVTNDGKWTEFWYQCPCRNYPAVFAAAGEVANGLPVMRFHASGLQNASYELRAKLYTSSAGRGMRYYYGFSPVAPTAFFTNTVGGAGGAEGFAEYLLGTVGITNGEFNLYVQDALLQSGSDPFFGWASLRLVQLNGALDHITVTPNPGQAPMSGNTQFTAQGYDALNVPINGLVFSWSASAGGTIDQNGLFTSGGVAGLYPNAISAQSGSVTGHASVNVYTPVLHHFDLDPIPTPQYAGTTFAIKVTARDQHGNAFLGNPETVQFSDTTGTISPASAGTFVAGVWTGDAAMSQTMNGVTITATSGSASGTSNAFDVLESRAGLITIDCSNDAQQAPVLQTTTDANQLITTDGVWTEFLYPPARPYPAVFAASGEAAHGLPVMRFHDRGIKHGTYTVRAKVYTNAPGWKMRYFYRYTPEAPTPLSIDADGDDGGTEQFAFYPLQTFEVTSGHFDIYVQDATLLPASTQTYPFFGWASIELCAVTMTWYRDLDGDGFGDPGTTLEGDCTQPAGYVATSGDCNDGTSAVHPGADDASCNGVDENCNGSNDEGYVSIPTSCGAGACASTGLTSCVAGTVHDSCMAGDPQAPDTNCNGIDDDCNGTADEGYAPVATSCGVGPCASTGVSSCVAGTVQDSCVAGTPAPSDATCNGIDDNCNGSNDEGYVAVATSCGVGACASTGVTSCVAGSVQDSCVAGTPAPSDATCNGIDDNCNGTADEGYAPVATSCGVGACASTGVTSCVAGSLQDSCIAGTPAPESCDGIDNNCDGTVDNDVGPTWHADTDGDGHGALTPTQQACTQPPGYVASSDDCNDADGEAFGLPIEVTGLTMMSSLGSVQIDWTSQAADAGSGTVYDLVTGSIADLVPDDGFASATCLASGTTINTHMDQRENLPTTYYLIRARNSCGTGTFGASTVLPDRRDALDATACP